MPSIGLAAAARLTGRNQSTIHRAMKTGRLSYIRDEAGERRIDVAELERVFGLKSVESSDTFRTNGASLSKDAGNLASHDTHVPSVEGTQGQTLALERLLDDRERTIADLREAIRDLRARLDRETEERRGLIALLTAPDRRPWWRRWFR